MNFAATKKKTEKTKKTENRFQKTMVKRLLTTLILELVINKSNEQQHQINSLTIYVRLNLRVRKFQTSFERFQIKATTVQRNY